MGSKTEKVKREREISNIQQNVDALVSGVGAQRKGGKEEQEQNRVIIAKTAKVQQLILYLSSHQSKILILCLLLS